MKISIVLPVYNEADNLKACLESISKQTIRPHEVIVVDNNSTDNTAIIARSFNFVTLLNEPLQGVVHARTTGFNAASGDIVARIDGDSILLSDWLAQIKTIFSNPETQAVSGVALYYSVGAERTINAIDLFFRRRLQRQLKHDMYLWGANMALRKKAWLKVRSDLCQRGDQHEDFDIAIHLQALGYKVSFDERLIANVSARRINMDFFSFMRYVWISPSTYAQHGIKVKRQLYPIVLICAVGYLPGWFLYRGYDSSLKRFSLTYLLFSTSQVGRIDPTANVA